MRKPNLLLCSLALLLTGCASSHDRSIRAREERPFPNPTLGTDNPESQWYKTQILASPSAPSTTGAGAVGSSTTAVPGTNKPARLSKTPSPTTPAPPNTKAGSTGAST